VAGRDVTQLIRDLASTVIPAVPVPFHGEGIDVESQRAYIHWMAGQQVGGVAVWAHTGRGPHLTVDQRVSVLDAWRTGMPRTRIVCGVGPSHDLTLPEEPEARHRAVLDDALANARLAREGGADVLMAHPPRALARLPGASGRIVEYHAALAASGVPVIAFLLYEAAGGVSYDPSTVSQILALDGVVGIKIATLDSIMTFQDVARLVAERSEALIITGEDRFLGYTLMCGAQAALIGLAAACTDVVVSLVDAWRHKRHETFIELSARIDRFAAATFRAPMEGYVQRMLWALEDDGVVSHAGRDPFGPSLEDTDRRSVREAVRALRV